jgi:hypothetical protein
MNSHLFSEGQVLYLFTLLPQNHFVSNAKEKRPPGIFLNQDLVATTFSTHGLRQIFF